MTRDWLSVLAKYAVVLGCSLYCVNLGPQSAVWAQEADRTRGPQPSAPTEQPSALMYLPYAQFKIPFHVELSGREPYKVQLWVSTDAGATWQMHGNAEPQAKHFDFRAAAEGLYLFSVQTVDSGGTAFPSQSPPLRVQIDTTKPMAAVRADINADGKLVVDVRVADKNLNPESATLRLRSDQESEWLTARLDSLTQDGDVYEGQAIVDVAPCREIAIVFSIMDRAENSGEATFRLTMPRTATGEQEMTLASTHGVSGQPSRTFGPGSSLTAIPGAIAWNPEASAQRPAGAPSAAQLVSADGLKLESSGASPRVDLEELPPPNPLGAKATEPQRTHSLGGLPVGHGAEPAGELSTLGRAFHCKSQAFSLDYSVEALGGTSLAKVELWGTEDGGRNWQQWGTDPDRQSPFDVQVGNDGLFGFRMVIVGSNGLVSNRPKAGDSADVWINVDTVTPTAKITRAVYGEGPEDGMLVIDYAGQDGHLVERPVTLSFSESIDGPWTTIVTGQKRSGIYLWKADPNLPDRIYLRLEVVDKAGNIGEHRLDLPIDVKGLAPRGRIQGFRPILSTDR